MHVDTDIVFDTLVNAIVACGGCFRGCVIFIIASWVWMMYSLFNFVLGPLLDKVICTAVNDPSFFIIDKVRPACTVYSHASQAECILSLIHI